MKKFLLGVVMSVLFVAQSAFAMTFQQPVEIGNVGGTPVGGFVINGATKNDGELFRMRDGKTIDSKTYRGTVYGKGIARFGDGDDALYMHYDCSKERTIQYVDAYSPKFGDKDAKRTVSLMAGEDDFVQIYRIQNDSDITLYLLRDRGSVDGTTIYVLLGRRSDGVFVKYFDMEDINIQYFGLKKNKYGTTRGMHNPCYESCRCEGDTIIIDYGHYRGRSGYVKEGEFRFKWDETAQWFGVEQVKY